MFTKPFFCFVFCCPNSVSTEMSLSHQEEIKGNIFVWGLNEKAKVIFFYGSWVWGFVFLCLVSRERRKFDRVADSFVYCIYLSLQTWFIHKPESTTRHPKELGLDYKPWENISGEIYDIPFDCTSLWGSILRQVPRMTKEKNVSMYGILQVFPSL